MTQENILSQDVITRQFNHARLEQVIYGHTPVAEILQNKPPYLGDYAVVDFVGSHQIDQERFGAGDLIQASARIFFEDAGAFVTSFEGAAYGKPFNLVLFATFVVIEIAPYTARAKFVVLAPAASNASADSPYAGLMRSANTDEIRERLAAENDLGPLMQALEDLLLDLSAPAVDRRQRPGLLRRLLGH